MGDYPSCAFALPDRPPGLSDDGTAAFPTDARCPNASISRKNGSVGWLPGTRLCTTCSRYTDAVKAITIRQGDFTARIYFDRLEEAPLVNIRKLFKIILQRAPEENEEAIRNITRWLSDAVTESEESWRSASALYADRWRVPNDEKSKAARALRAYNSALLKNVKHTKAQHDRWVKLQSNWAEMSI